MPSKAQLPAKKDVALALLEQSTVLVHLDPRAQSVRVPAWFKNQAQLVLQVGLNTFIPIPDLSLDDEALSCTLSFGRTPHFCYVPWRSVYALVGEDGRGMVWPDDVPPEVAAQAERAVEQHKKAGKAAKPASLRAVDEPPGEGDSEKDQTLEAPAAAASKAKRKRARRKAQATRAEKPRREPAPAPALARKEQASAAAPGKGVKGKRELPPYLRIVK